VQRSAYIFHFRCISIYSPLSPTLVGGRRRRTHISSDTIDLPALFLRLRWAAVGVIVTNDRYLLFGFGLLRYSCPLPFRLLERWKVTPTKGASHKYLYSFWIHLAFLPSPLSPTLGGRSWHQT